MSLCVVRQLSPCLDRRLCSAIRRKRRPILDARLPPLHAQDPDQIPFPLDSPLKDDSPLRPLFQELPKLLRVCTPAFFHGIFALSLPSVICLCIGRLGTMELSIISLALAFYYLTGASIVEGLTIAVEILGGQAHGAGNRDLVDLTFGRGWMLSMMTCCLVAIVWSRSEWIFLRLGQDPTISRSASDVLRWMIPYFFVDATVTCLTKSLASRGIVRPTMIACGLATVMAPVMLWALILRTPLGIYGAPVALFMLSIFTVSVVMYLKPNVDRKSIVWWKDRRLRQWNPIKTYLITTLPSLLTVCSEWWMFEIFGFLAGLLPEPEISLGIMGATNGVINAVFLAAFTLAGGTIVRVSNNLGAGNKAAASTSMRTGILLAVVLESLILLQLCLFSGRLAGSWFTDSTSRSALMSIVPWVAITECGSGMSYVLGSILRGCNRGLRELVVDFSTYWLVAFPLGTGLGFVCGMAVKGFWIGLATAGMIQFVTIAWMVSRLDLETETQRARKLVT